MKNSLYIILIMLAAYVIFSKKKKQQMKDTEPKQAANNFTEADAEKAIKTVKDIYGTATAQIVEKIFRHETAHFTSEQYRRTGTAGMTVGAWRNLPKLPIVTGIGKVNKAGEQSKQTLYYVWNPKDFSIYLAEFLKRHNMNAGAWNSVKKEKQFEYISKLTGVKTHFA